MDDLRIGGVRSRAVRHSQRARDGCAGPDLHRGLFQRPHRPDQRHHRPGWVSFGATGSGTGQFNHPGKIAVDNLGRIYVTDTYNYRVVRIDDMTGAGWTAYGHSGSGTGTFNQPSGIAVSSTYQIYVTDPYVGEIIRFDDMTGSNWTTFGSTGTGVGQYSFPVDIMLDNSGHMIVTDRSQGVIQSGLMSTAGWSLYPMPAANPQSCYVSGSQVYIVDQSNGQLTRINSIGGSGKLTFGTDGTGTDQFHDPSGVIVR
ncbi:MAG TPA: NHL repeat-containing protein [Fimbriimonadaceae bacterium]|nr:NHL repeat-containing protein [Fimbriimonadaceae bacterium]